MAQRPSDTFHPGFLDFVNRPNPVEPSNINHSHGLPSGSQLQSRTNDDILRRLEPARAGNVTPNSITPGATVLDPESETGQIEHPIVGRLRDGEQLHLTLPPPNKHDTQSHQPQVPPVLQGLHHPPPNSGILPSMNAEKAQTTQRAKPTHPRAAAPVPEETVATTTDTLPRPARRNKWTDAETHALLQGTRRFGVGAWKKILTCPDYSFNHRTATDLKDRFRVVSSNKDMLARYAVYDTWKRPPPDPSAAAHLASSAESSDHATPPEAPPSLDFLPRAKRRQRTKWSEEEDDALLRGFGRYGASWTSIQLDPVLKKRTPTDIRDRIRTRFSDAYTKAGLTPKPAKPRTQMRSRPQQPAEPSSAPRSDPASGAGQEGLALALPSLPSLFAE